MNPSSVTRGSSRQSQALCCSAAAQVGIHERGCFTFGHELLLQGVLPLRVGCFIAVAVAGHGVVDARSAAGAQYLHGGENVCRSCKFSICFFII